MDMQVWVEGERAARERAAATPAVRARLVAAVAAALLAAVAVVLLASIVAVLLATAAVAGATVGVAAAPASPTASSHVLPGEPNVPWDDGAVPAEVRANLVDVRPRRWEHVLLASDGRTATVYFSMGPEACEGLAGIDVTPTDTGYRVLVRTGAVPGADACAEVVQLYRAVIVLDEPVISGGGLLDLPGGSLRRAGD